MTITCIYLPPRTVGRTSHDIHSLAPLISLRMQLAPILIMICPARAEFHCVVAFWPSRSLLRSDGPNVRIVGMHTAAGPPFTLFHECDTLMCAVCIQLAAYMYGSWFWPVHLCPWYGGVKRERSAITASAKGIEHFGVLYKYTVSDGKVAMVWPDASFLVP